MNDFQRVRATLNRLVTIAPPIIDSYSQPGPHCVLATAIGQQVLGAYGIASEPWSVEIVVFNDAWKRWGDEANFDGGVEEQQKRGAYMLTNTPNWSGPSIPMQGPNPSKPWDGHLVLRVPQGRLAYLVDLDLGSFRRPAQQIEVPGGMVTTIHPNDTVLGALERSGSPTTHLGYRSMTSAFADDYLTAGDWIKRERYGHIVVEILDAMKVHKEAKSA